MNKEACLLEAINQSARLLEFLETISRQIVMRMTFWPLSEIELLQVEDAQRKAIYPFDCTQHPPALVE